MAENHQTAAPSARATAMQTTAPPAWRSVCCHASGSSARQTVLTKDKPCDAVIMAIVDTWELNGDVKYQK
jgi:hypothetical protein